PNGKTLHVPSDGRPLPGFEQALASYKARKGSGAPAIELASAGGSSKKSGGFLSAFFGGGSDEADDSADVETASAAPPPKARNVKPAAAAKTSNLPGIAIVAPENAQRAEIPQVTEEQAPEPEQEQDTPETIIAALPARSIPLPDFAPRPKADVGAQPPENVPFAMADATATTEQAVATAHAPANVPFGMADVTAADATASADPAQVAVNNIPLPTWRPDTSLPAALASPPSKDVLMALAETADHGKTATDAFSVLPTARPEMARPDAVKAVLDEANAQVGAADAYQVASLSEPRSAFNDPSGTDAATPREAVVA
ncbi:peptidase M15, partial [Mesorhizobium sp. M7D.F.Ca.US.004.01.2.1]